MVDQSLYLDRLFNSLADPTRRDILLRLITARYTVSQLAEQYDISFAGVAKHLTVLEKAKLIRKQKKGREQVVSIAPQAVKDANYYLKQYEVLWNDRLSKIDAILKEGS
ncbi:transcriptional regulator, ArsR family [candidate division TM7 genomosp. GTL1]|nr:transcriptional regulator, ArsR family [candidate division TM7 genomosp. GTL1]